MIRKLIVHSKVIFDSIQLFHSLSIYAKEINSYVHQKYVHIHNRLCIITLNRK